MPNKAFSNLLHVTLQWTPHQCISGLLICLSAPTACLPILLLVLCHVPVRSYRTCLSLVMYCTDPGEVDHSIRLISDPVLLVGTTIQYTCNPGFVLEGSSLLTCYSRETGTPIWTSRLPHCVCKLGSVLYGVAIISLLAAAVLLYSLLSELICKFPIGNSEPPGASSECGQRPSRQSVPDILSQSSETIVPILSLPVSSRLFPPFNS